MFNGPRMVWRCDAKYNRGPQKDEGYEHYGSVTVSVRDTETNEVQTANVDFCPSKDVGEATAEAIKEASDKF